MDLELLQIHSNKQICLGCISITAASLCLVIRLECGGDVCIVIVVLNKDAISHADESTQHSMFNES